jgi:hypothetical protein
MSRGRIEGRVLDGRGGVGTAMVDVLFVGIPFVFLGLCLLYIRGTSRL